MCWDTFLRSKPPSDMDTVKRSTVVQLPGLPRSEWTRHDNSSSNSLAILALGPFWSILDLLALIMFDRFIIVLSCFIWICFDMLTIVNFSSYSFVSLKPLWRSMSRHTHQSAPAWTFSIYGWTLKPKMVRSSTQVSYQYYIIFYTSIIIIL